MGSMQEIQARIDSVRVTRQIAQAMQLVANTKMSRCRQLRLGSRPFFQESMALLEAVAAASDGRGPAFERREKPALYIVAGSDRGLCGGYNINVCRMALERIRKEPHGAVIFALGGRIQDFFTRRGVTVEKGFRGISQSPFYLDGKAVADQAIDLLYSGAVGKVLLVYTAFESMLIHTPTQLELLPLPAPQRGGPPRQLEPEAEDMLRALLPDYLAGCIFGALAEGSLCEQSARVTSMDSAVKNCEDLIEEMQLAFNLARQAAITQEINEIVSGANC